MDDSGDVCLPSPPSDISLIITCYLISYFASPLSMHSTLFALITWTAKVQDRQLNAPIPVPAPHSEIFYCTGTKWRLITNKNCLCCSVKSYHTYKGVFKTSCSYFSICRTIFCGHEMLTEYRQVKVIRYLENYKIYL